MAEPRRQPESVRPLHERLRKVRDEKGLSWSDLHRLAEGVSYETVKAVMRDPSNPKYRYPGPDVLRSILRALGEDPMSYPEYELALARRALDERQAGMEAALENLNRVRSLLPLEALDEPTGAAGEMEQLRREMDDDEGVE